MTDDELVAEIVTVMEASAAHYQDIEATVWEESPDPQRLAQLREAGDRTTADWYTVVNLCGSAMRELEGVGDHWNWPVVVRALDPDSRQQLETFFARNDG